MCGPNSALTWTDVNPEEPFWLQLCYSGLALVYKGMGRGPIPCKQLLESTLVIATEYD